MRVLASRVSTLAEPVTPLSTQLDFVCCQSYNFSYLWPHAKFHNPRRTPSGRKVTNAKGERRKGKEKKRLYLLLATPEGSGQANIN